jgi:DNA-binding LacI/PurR family transcriptional regulator
MDVRIAVAAQGFGDLFQGHVYAEIRKLLHPGQSVVECAIPRWDEAAFVRAHLLSLLEGERRPTALIGICMRPDLPMIASFRGAGIPVVLIDERAEGASTVASDNLTGGYLAGQYLVRKGRKSIAMVSGPVRDYNALQRMRGIAKALSESGLPLPAESVIEAPLYSYRDGVSAMARLLDGPRKLDGVICAAGDACALGLLTVARERRVRVPEDIAIVGYDDSALASTSHPPLTTIGQSLEAIAREALRLAIEETTAILLQPKTILLEPKLVPRASA